ncbi:MAG: glutamine amidotransferase [Granulosicoccus sp.]|nr:glutamine amidotransferase [Granulosicoccus sp.]
MFEFFFKYPQHIWSSGTLEFARAWPLPVGFIALAAFVFLCLLFIARQPLSMGRKVTVVFLQAITGAAVLFMLWQPVLSVEEVKPGDNTIAYVLDNSESMYFIDGDGEKARLASVSQPLIDSAEDLASTFTAQWYIASDSLQAMDDPLDRPAPSNQSALADSLASLMGNISNQSLAAVVMVSDGADNVGNMDSDWWQQIKSAGIPVHVLGVGAEALGDDIELTDVSMVERAAPKTPVRALLRIRHGLSGKARIRVHAGASLLHAQDIELSDAQNETVASVEFNSGEEGIYELRFSVQAVDVTETNRINNAQPRMLEVAYQPQRILYVEGEPRWEYKFIRRALDDHQELAVVSLLRTSPNKYYRQGVSDANELKDGFPATREELFAYDAVIIGSLEAAVLNTNQQANLRDFVSQRGGSLLMIAGSSGLGDGGWGRSLVSEALPVRLTSRTDTKTYVRSPATALLTQQGLRTEWLRLDIDQEQNIIAWQSLPPVSDYQTVESTKPGAVTALSAISEDGTTPLLVWQRYGQGYSYVLSTAGTWRWQMRLPSEDQRHESFWKQFLQRITETTVPRVTFDAEQTVLRDIEDLDITVVARNDNFEPLEVSTLPATLTLPDGTRSELSLLPDLSEPGRYRSSVQLSESGPVKLSINLEPAGESGMASDGAVMERWWVRESGTAEFFNAVQNQTFLNRLASETGGQYFTLATLNGLNDALLTANSAQRTMQQLPLWNMPVLFFILLLAKLVEWMLRLRWKRL